MKNKKNDKKLDRISKILEIITNLGTIGSWFLSIGSAYVLSIQQFPVVFPLINITLDVYFQYSLIICGMLAYIHLLQKFWKSNVEKMELSKTFYDFIFWDLPRFKIPLLLIPIILIVTVSGQITKDSIVLPTISLIIYLVIFFLIASRFFYFYISPERKIDNRRSQWINDEEWIYKWSKRIDEKIIPFGYCCETDLKEFGYTGSHQADAEIRTAMACYFHRYEFSKNIVFILSTNLSHTHPLHSYVDAWILLRKDLMDWEPKDAENVS